MPLLTVTLLLAACISSWARLLIEISPVTLFSVDLAAPLRVNVPVILVPASPFNMPLSINTLPEIAPLWVISPLLTIKSPPTVVSPVIVPALTMTSLLAAFMFRVDL